MAVQRQLFDAKRMPLALDLPDEPHPQGPSSPTALLDPDEFMDCLATPIKVMLGGSELLYVTTDPVTSAAVLLARAVSCGSVLRETTSAPRRVSTVCAGWH